jgi:hypothetical protein
MSFFVTGLVLGAYAGALFREEYNFPTADKISKAVEIFRKNEAKIEQQTAVNLLLPTKPETKEGAANA